MTNPMDIKKVAEEHLFRIRMKATCVDENDVEEGNDFVTEEEAQEICRQALAAQLDAAIEEIEEELGCEGTYLSEERQWHKARDRVLRRLKEARIEFDTFKPITTRYYGGSNTFYDFD